MLSFNIINIINTIIRRCEMKSEKIKFLFNRIKRKSLAILTDYRKIAHELVNVGPKTVTHTTIFVTLGRKRK